MVDFGSDPFQTSRDQSRRGHHLPVSRLRLRSSNFANSDFVRRVDPHNEHEAASRGGLYNERVWTSYLARFSMSKARWPTDGVGFVYFISSPVISTVRF